jgi:uncharacterized protein (DUF305 family)
MAAGNLRPRAIAVLCSLTAVLATGCSTTGGEPAGAGEPAPNIVQPGAPGEPAQTLTPEELAAIEPPRYTRVDVRFMQGMIHHHAQALLMTSWVPERAESEDVKLLAQRMELSQEAEVELMQAWLDERAQEVPLTHIPHGHAHGPGGWMAPGMLTREDLDRLEAAEGAEFERLFLEQMIVHHEGALTMVEELYEANGGQEPEVDRFARHVVSDQEIEIGRMQALLGQLASG